MFNFSGTEIRCAFQNDACEYFRAWAFTKDGQRRYCLCLDGYRRGKNLCPFVNGGEALESITDVVNLADSLTTFDWNNRKWRT